MFVSIRFRARRAAWPTPTAGILAVALLLGTLAGCSDSTTPAADGGNRLDPVTGSIALKDLTVPGPDGQTVLLRLEGGDLVADPEAGTVTLAVSVRNLSGTAVNGPLVVWLTDVQPDAVVPLNADVTLPPSQIDRAVAATDSMAWGFDYTSLLGGEPLAAGAATPAKNWLFRDVELSPFSFAARIETGPFAGQARLGGRLFVDLDGDGLPAPDEPPFFAGGVQVTGPDGVVTWSSAGADGRWEVAVTAAGLYECLFQSYAMTPLPIGLTTPNPLNVVITSDAEGDPQSWLDAHFGIARGWTPPPVPGVIGFTDRRPAELHRAPWMLLGATPYGPSLELAVGYSGCQPLHEFSLWMSGEFMESMPPRAHLTLVHETEEACDAAFTDTLRFDLWPLFARYVESYGSGPLILILHGPDDFVHEIALATVPPDSVWPAGVRLPD